MERRKHDSTMKRMMRDLKEGAADALDMISMLPLQRKCRILILGSEMLSLLSL